MNDQLIKDILYLLDSWERGADAQDYVNEISAIYQTLNERKNEFKPDWDMIKPFQDRIKELDKGCAECGVKTTDGYALYCVKCSEPMREWVELTDEEIRDVHWSKPMDEYSFARAIEAKLKEKNSD